MKEAEIKIRRTESALEELIPLALAEFNDERLNSLNIVRVKCSKGRYDATVYISPEGYLATEKKEILRQLRKCTGHIGSFCLASEGWFKMPTLTFTFDESVEKEMALEAIFEKLKKDRDGSSENH